MLLNLSIAREIAYDAFVKIFEAQQKPEEILEEFYNAQKKPLKRQDRNLVKEMVYGGLRWYSKLYWILQNTSKRNLDESSWQIKASLVLGTYQIYYMDRIPDRAAVTESVEYIRKRGQANACSFVNGILRQISRRAEYFAKPDKQKQPVDYLSLQFAHPEWIVSRWFKRFGFTKMELMLAANNLVPPTSVRINTIKTPVTDAHELQQSLLRDEKTHSERRPLRTCLRLREFPNLDGNSLFGEGFYTLQDEAAQLIALLVQPAANEHILDACCAPGGKLGHIYELGGGQITLAGMDASEPRIARTKETIDRLQHQGVELMVQDLLTIEDPKPTYDKVLLDAPCSGLGVLKRHPEGKWQKKLGDINHYAKQQRKLIEKALRLLKPGGELIFSVCSFEPEETNDHLGWLYDKYRDNLSLVSPISRLPDYYKRYVTRDNLLLVYSGNQDDMDGFGAFIVRLEKELG